MGRNFLLPFTLWDDLPPPCVTPEELRACATLEEVLRRFKAEQISCFNETGQSLSLSIKKIFLDELVRRRGTNEERAQQILEEFVSQF